MALRDTILSQPSKPVEPVATPEWPNADGKVFVRSLTAAERVSLAISAEEGDRTNYTAKLVALAACDSEGKRIFGDEDAVLIGKLDNPPVERIALEAQRLSGIGLAAEAEMKKN